MLAFWHLSLIVKNGLMIRMLFVWIYSEKHFLLAKKLLKFPKNTTFFELLMKREILLSQKLELYRKKYSVIICQKCVTTCCERTQHLILAFRNYSGRHYILFSPLICASLFLNFYQKVILFWTFFNYKYLSKFLIISILF